MKECAGCEGQYQDHLHVMRTRYRAWFTSLRKITQNEKAEKELQYLETFHPKMESKNKLKERFIINRILITEKNHQSDP